MKYCIFINKSYSGLAYDELTQTIRDFYKNPKISKKTEKIVEEYLIVTLEKAPIFKTDVSGNVIETLTYSDEEYSKQVLIARNLEIQSELREKFIDTQLLCVSTGEVWVEKYPKFSILRETLLEEYNSNEVKISTFNN